MAMPLAIAVSHFARLDPFDEDQALAFGERAHRLEAVGLERLARVA